jgi:hypothetical protein
MPSSDIKVELISCGNGWTDEEPDPNYFTYISSGFCYQVTDCNTSGGAYSSNPNPEYFTTKSALSHNYIACHRVNGCASGATNARIPNSTYYTSSVEEASGVACAKASCNEPYYSSIPNGTALASFGGIVTCYMGDCSKAGECDYYWKSTLLTPTNSDMIKYTRHDEYQQCYKAECINSNGYYSDATVFGNYFSTDSADDPITGKTCHYVSDCNLLYTTNEKTNTNVFYYMEVPAPEGVSKKCYMVDCNISNGYNNKNTVAISEEYFTTVQETSAPGITCIKATGCQEGYTSTGTGTPVAQSGDVKCYASQCPGGYFYYSSGAFIANPYPITHTSTRYTSDSSSSYYNCWKITGCQTDYCDNSIVGISCSPSIYDTDNCTTAEGKECCPKKSTTTTCPIGYYSYSGDGDPSQIGYKYTEHSSFRYSGCWKVECADGYSENGTGINVTDLQLNSGLTCKKDKTTTTFTCPTHLTVSISAKSGTNSYLSLGLSLTDVNGVTPIQTAFMQEITINKSMNISGSVSVLGEAKTLTGCNLADCVFYGTTYNFYGINSNDIKNGRDVPLGDNYDRCCAATSATLSSVTLNQGSLEFTYDGRTCIINKVRVGATIGSGTFNPIK